MNISIPTNTIRNIHVEADGDGGFKGLPPEFRKMLEDMLTLKEQKNKQNIEA